MAPFTNLAPANSVSFIASLDTSVLGSFETSYMLATSDEDLPGATVLVPLTLQLSARVAIGGDATLDDVVNLSDFNVLAANFGQGDRTWQTGDFNRDGLVNLSDFNILAANFGISAAGSQVTARDWARLGAAVPEPTALACLGVAAAAILRRRRARTPAQRP